MFGRRKKQKLVDISIPHFNIPLSSLTSVLLDNLIADSVSAQKIKVSEYEREFFIALEEQMRIANLSLQTAKVERKSNGTLALYYNCQMYKTLGGWHIGSVHLRKKFGGISYCTEVLDLHNMDDAPIEAVIAVIPYWIDYIKKLIRQKKAIMST